MTLIVGILFLLAAVAGLIVSAFIGPPPEKLRVPPMPDSSLCGELKSCSIWHEIERLPDR